jgi:hypothetical protein
MFRNGSQAYLAYRADPGSIYETPDPVSAKGAFTPKRSRSYRIFRAAGKLVYCLITLKLIGLTARLSYYAGYLFSMIFKEKNNGA